MIILKSKVNIEFHSRHCLAILERKKDGTHFRSNSTMYDLLNWLIFISKIWAITFEEDLRDEICNSMASEKDLRWLAKKPFVGRILEQEPERNFCVILIFRLFETCDLYKKIPIKKAQSI